MSYVQVSTRYKGGGVNRDRSSIHRRWPSTRRPSPPARTSCFRWRSRPRMS